jgi:2,3-bisphosphoglycerate-independent phosphoglycerate mutase
MAGLPLVLTILDGFGVGPLTKGNPFRVAHMPVLKKLSATNPHTLLTASGRAVGLPAGQAGNSEAGHVTIGAGRRVEQDGMRITLSISDGTFAKNTAFRAAIHHAKKHGSNIHLMGLVTSRQSGHADPSHVNALVELLRPLSIPVFLHCFTDGRDSSPYSSIKALRKLQAGLPPHIKIVTVMGRLYGMDRKKDWRRTRRAFEALVGGQGFKSVTPEQAVLAGYNRGESDEFIQPTVVEYSDTPARESRIHRNDSIIFWNFRSDRARQLTKAFVQDGFQRKNAGAFSVRGRPSGLLFVAMTDFGPDLGEVLTAFPAQDLKHTLTAELGDLRQLYIAETEKYAHITYFFNGGYANPVAKEQRMHVPSPRLDHYDEQPAMATPIIIDEAIRALDRKAFDIIVMNIASPDMIGHTGNFRAGIRALENVDYELGRLANAVLKRHQGTLIVTGDHGNIEEMQHGPMQEMDTAHSTFPVPFIFASALRPRVRLKTGTLANIAPTILDFLGRPIPDEMTTPLCNFSASRSS